MDTFNLHDRKVFIAGESYAGYYVPYIADAMHNASDLCYYNIQSIMVWHILLLLRIMTHSLIIMFDMPSFTTRRPRMEFFRTTFRPLYVCSRL